MLGDDENDNKCLEVDITTKKLMIRACDSKKESQLWKLWHGHVGRCEANLVSMLIEFLALFGV